MWWNKMFTEFDKEAFWRTVEATMVEIFGINAREAYLSTNQLRSEVTLHYQNRKPELFYNQEAFDVAAKLAKHSDDGRQIQWETYLNIKRRYQIDENEQLKVTIKLGTISIEVEGKPDYVAAQVDKFVEHLDSPERNVQILSLSPRA
jgi:hypothetical protein